MQNIQDKEFDQLFRDRFEGAETEPSANLWENIETQLGNKPKRVFPVYWIAAALCAAVVAVGLLFRQSEKPQGITSVAQTAVSEHRSANGRITAKEKPLAVIDPVVRVSGSLSADAARPSSERVKPASARKLLAYTKVSAGESVSGKAAANVQASETKKDLTAMQPLMLIAHPENRTVSVKQKKEQLPESGKDTPEELMLASAAAAKDETADDHGTREKHRGIRNIGDLVNYVVNKLDKREEKMLKFETNDDESSLIGINIGMIRFSRKDKNNN